MFILKMLLFAAPLFAEDCDKWFINKKLKPGAGCFDSCQLKALNPDPDMDCVAQCRQLCKSEVKTYTSSSTRGLTYYPGLTEAEKNLVQRNPKEALKVYFQKNTAEEETQKLFPNSLRNDESDAFRHFIWAGLLTKEIGTDRAKVYLDAHEATEVEPKSERAMDFANNRAGLLEAQKLLKTNELTLKNIENKALQELHEKKLIVLEPQSYIPEEIK